MQDNPAKDDDASAQRKNRGRMIAGISVAGLAVLAGAAYVGAAWYTSNKLPAQLTVEGVDVSGHSEAEAKKILEKELGQRAERSLTLTVDDSSTQVTPKNAGLRIDAAATVDQFTGWSWNPSTIVERLSGAQHVSAKTHVDSQKLQREAQKVADALTTSPKEGGVKFKDAKVQYSQPEDGHKVTKEQAQESIRQQWLSAAKQAKVSSTNVDPKISDSTWQTFVDESAKPLASGPVTVKAGDETAKLTKYQLTKVASVDTEGDEPHIVLDEEGLSSALSDANPKLKSTAKDATIKLTGSGAKAKTDIVPAHTGKGVEPEELSTAVVKATSSKDRTAKVKLRTQKPDITTAEAKKWKITKVASFSTPYPDDSTRTLNLKAGAKRVNGTVVEPGESFSLAQQLGPVTEANGYYSSGVVSNGISTQATGGGLSQIATMSYNAGYLAGMDIEAYQPHSRWFDRYPAGRESTFWEGSINVKWKNNTKAPLAVAMWLSNGKVHTAVYGHKTWDVKTHTSDFYNYTSGRTIESDDPDCMPESSGKKGFTVDVTRTRKNVSTGDVKKDSRSTVYEGWPNVTCTAK